MIRWFFAALVLANIGVWMWTSWYMEPAPAGETARTAVRPEQMKLIGEPGVKLKPRPAPAQAPAPGAAVETPRACYRAGPYTDLEAAVAAGKRLDERGVASMRREETSRTVSGYRVFLPPFPTKQAAEAKRRQLVRLGFNDNALVQERGRYGISLGVFAVEANAIERQRSLIAKGIKAKLEPIQHAHAAYWLELTGENLFETLRNFNWNAPGVALAEYPCTAPTHAEALIAPDP
jgi:SPOR domain